LFIVSLLWIQTFSGLFVASVAITRVRSHCRGLTCFVGRESWRGVISERFLVDEGFVTTELFPTNTNHRKAPVYGALAEK
jgi:hypothetical protein